MFSKEFTQQLELLVQILPELSTSTVFGLKGGTAINLFVQDLPRLSVDLDLVYLPIQDRETSLQGIHHDLERMNHALQKRGFRVQSVALRGTEYGCKLIVSQAQKLENRVKLEVSPVLRGTVFETTLREAQPQVIQHFGYAQVPVVSLPDLYAGKIMAALDRQHPRDLFDISKIFEQDLLSPVFFPMLMQALMVYLISHDRPISEVLQPKFKDISNEYQNHFVGMTRVPVALEILLQARLELVQQIQHHLTASHKQFLLSFKALEPRWELLGVDHAPDLPAVKWKMQNLSKMPSKNRQAALQKLERTLELF
jgi:predicted nucleotidyltransferase component of viral defense system